MNMLGSPSKSQGIKVILTRNVSCYKKGQVGIARKFNPVDIFQNIKSYNEAIFWNGKLPDLNHSYDFHPIVTHNDKKIVSVWHTHISVFDFEEIN
jgi:hypothetical protein